MESTKQDNATLTQNERFGDEYPVKYIPPEPFSGDTFHVLNVIFRICLNGTISLVGIVSNSINIVMFYRQGFLSHSSVVNLTALAVSDFLCCFFNGWGAVLGIFHHLYDTSSWSWDVYNFYVHTAGRPNNTASQITCWVTAFLAFERAVSVTFPFKAKTLFSPKRSIVIMISIYVIMTSLNIPSLFTHYLKWKTDVKKNRTLIDFHKFDYITPYLKMIFFYTCPVTLRNLSIVVVVFCNFVIFWKVYLSQKFRRESGALQKSTQKQPSRQQHQSVRGSSERDEAFENSDMTSSNLTTSSKSAQEATSSTKEMRLVRMITLISIIFTCCYVPSVLHVLLGYIVFTYALDYHWWIDLIVYNSVTTLQLLSASTNIVIYYKLSSRFREEFLLCLGGKKHS